MYYVSPPICVSWGTLPGWIPRVVLVGRRLFWQGPFGIYTIELVGLLQDKRSTLRSPSMTTVCRSLLAVCRSPNSLE